MRALAAAACLVGVAVVMSGCGVAKNPGTIAVKTIEDDWQGFYVASNDPFPSRPDLAGKDTLRSIHCGDKTTAAGTLTCTLVAGHGAHGGTAITAHVLVRFDAQDVLRQWKFTG
ncbi:MAG TPA: hypothetical protein VFD90_04995 [Gaiellales bacterium]|jgi:hypothetical protein|nr:hypothetical protein [Gaiellales bacterium]